MPNAGDVFIVPDATKDRRFRNSALVTGPPFIRFYTGAALSVCPGLNIGTLCIIDTVPREVDEKGKECLKRLAAMVVDRLNMRKHLRRTQLSYIAGASHNLQHPLHGFRESMLELRRATRQKAPQQFGEALQEAEKAVDIMAWTIRKGLMSLRLQRMKAAPQASPRPVEVRAVLKRAMGWLDFIQSAVPISVRIAGDVPEVVHTDLNVLLHTFVDLLTNACRFTEEGIIQLDLFMTTHDNTPHLQVEVADTGVGITAVMQDSLFRVPFLAMQKDGTGLGLFCVRANMELVGGAYGYRGREDGRQGSVFWVRLPDMRPPSGAGVPPPPPTQSSGDIIAVPASRDPAGGVDRQSRSRSSSQLLRLWPLSHPVSTGGSSVALLSAPTEQAPPPPPNCPNSGAGTPTRHQLSPHAPLPDWEGLGLRGSRILIVDLSKQTCKLLSRMLTETNSSIDLAADVTEAMPMMARMSYRVILLHLTTTAQGAEGYAGLHFVQECRAYSQEQGIADVSAGAAILGYTGSMGGPDAGELAAAGLAGCFKKPFSKEDLHRQLLAALGHAGHSPKCAADSSTVSQRSPGPLPDGQAGAAARNIRDVLRRPDHSHPSPA